MSKSAIIITVVCVVCGVALIVAAAFLIFFVWRKRSRSGVSGGAGAEMEGISKKK